MEGGRTRAGADPTGSPGRAWRPRSGPRVLGGKGRAHRGQEVPLRRPRASAGAGEGGPVPTVRMKAPAGRQVPGAGGRGVFPRGAWGHGGDALF